MSKKGFEGTGLQDEDAESALRKQGEGPVADQSSGLESDPSLGRLVALYQAKKELGRSVNQAMNAAFDRITSQAYPDVFGEKGIRKVIRPGVEPQRLSSAIAEMERVSEESARDFDSKLLSLDAEIRELEKGLQDTSPDLNILRTEALYAASDAVGRHLKKYYFDPLLEEARAALDAGKG